MEGEKYIVASDGLIARKSGDWAKRKHHYLGNYCGITTVAMRGKFKLVYLDVMAGPGLCKMKDTGEEFPGSPFVALEHDFAEYIFVEDDAALADALRKRVDLHPKARKTKIWTDNWVKLAEAGRFRFDASTLVVAFVDPTGISQIPISAMRLLARNPKIDLLVTIQHRLSIVWNTPQYRKSKDGKTALDGFLGDQRWHEWDKMDATEFGRRAVEQFCEEFQQEGFIGSRHVSVPKDNPLYRFTLFSRHPRGDDFWNKVLKIDETGQRELL